MLRILSIVALALAIGCNGGTDSHACVGEEACDGSTPRFEFPGNGEEDVRRTDAAPDTAIEDAWLPGPDGSSDPGAEDASIPDTTPPDRGPEDTGPEDAGPEDLGPPDVDPEDAGPGDLGPEDAGPEDTGPPPPDPPGLLVYAPVSNISLTDPIRRARWDAAGEYALLVLGSGDLGLHQPNSGLAVGPPIEGDVADLAASTEPGVFYAVGTGGDGAPATWRIERAGGDFTVTPDGPALLGDPVVVVLVESGAWLFGTTEKPGSGYVNRLTFWSESKGVLADEAYASGAGLTGLMVDGKALHDSSYTVVTAEGLNGADSHDWIVASDLLVTETGYPFGGNPGPGQWRPGGSFGIHTAWVTNVVRIYDGAWHTDHLGPNSGAATFDVDWTADGSRALVVHGSTGSNLVAPVSELRPSGDDYDPTEWVDQSIQSFDEPPWNGDFDTDLLTVDWRPESACAEGIIGARRDFGALSLLIRFYDSADPDCQP